MMTKLFTEINEITETTVYKTNDKKIFKTVEITTYQTSDRKTFEVVQDAAIHQLELDFQEWYSGCPIPACQSLNAQYDILDLFNWIIEHRQTIKQFIELSEELDETGYT